MELSDDVVNLLFKTCFQKQMKANSQNKQKREGGRGGVQGKGEAAEVGTGGKGFFFAGVFFGWNDVEGRGERRVKGVV